MIFLYFYGDMISLYFYGDMIFLYFYDDFSFFSSLLTFGLPFFYISF